MHNGWSSEAIKSEGQRYGAQGRTQLQELLSDGEVSAEDYRLTFDTMRLCYEELGYQVTDPRTNPANGLTFIYEILPGSRSQESLERDRSTCEEPDMSVIEALYVTREQTMEEPLRVAASECLTRQGFDVPAEAKSLRDMSGDPTQDSGAQRHAAAQCIGQEALKLYPDLPYVPQGY